MWEGYATFGGTEVINAERTAAYAHNDGAWWFTDAMKSTTLHRVLGDAAYRSPLQDGDCPWADPVNPDSYGFYGFYPLSITGIDDSTRTSVIVEYNGDGGNAGRLRHGTRQMVFSGMLMGQDDASVEYGLSWLRSVLLTGVDVGCGTALCEGTELCFFAAEPPFDPDADDCGDFYLRTLNQVTVNSGPTVTDKKRTHDGGCVWQVQFTAVASDPFTYGLEQQIVDNFPASTAAEWHITGAQPDLDGRNFAEVPCRKRSYQPVFDPACPDLILPPSLPPVKLGCYTAPASWHRYSFRIPASLIPVWNEMVPVITIKTKTDPLRVMRIRLYPDPDGTFRPDDHPCQHCADFVVSYCPENSTMKIDGSTQSVLVLTPGESQRGDGLVFDTDGLPFTWPSLSCGIGYVVTIDTLKTASTATQRRTLIDFSVVPRVR